MAGKSVIKSVQDIKQSLIRLINLCDELLARPDLPQIEADAATLAKIKWMLPTTGDNKETGGDGEAATPPPPIPRKPRKPRKAKVNLDKAPEEKTKEQPD